MYQAVKVKLKLEEPQVEFFEQHAGASRWLYNQALAQQKDYYNETGKFLSYNKLANSLPIIKNIPEYSWLKNIVSTSLQFTLKNLDTAFSNFFNSLKGNRKGRNVGFPKFKSKRKCKASFTIISNSDDIRVQDNQLRIPKLGFVKVWSGTKNLSRIKKWEHIKSVTFSRDSDNNWYASILIEKDDYIKYPSTGITSGIDLGLKNSVIFNNGTVFNIPEKIEYLEKKIVKLNRSLHRKVKDSSNRDQARIKLGRCYFRIKKLRENFQHQLSHLIAKHTDIVTTETLDIQQMMSKRQFSKAVGRQGWYQFITFIKYKLEQSGKVLIQVDKTFPSSKLCSSCGYVHSNIKLSTREWVCPDCNTVHNRDINAAKNLDNISRWFKTTGETITSKSAYINSIVPVLGTI